MADLVSLANRLNDVEINQNQPVTTTTMQRIGSSINALLDFLGISNGTNTGGGTSGTLSDFFNAVNVVSAHTPTLLFDQTILINSQNNIVQIPQIPFVDVILLAIAGGSGSPQQPTSTFFDEYADKWVFTKGTAFQNFDTVVGIQLGETSVTDYVDGTTFPGSSADFRMPTDGTLFKAGAFSYHDPRRFVTLSQSNFGLINTRLRVYAIYKLNVESPGTVY